MCAVTTCTCACTCKGGEGCRGRQVRRGVQGVDGMSTSTTQSRHMNLSISLSVLIEPPCPSQAEALAQVSFDGLPMCPTEEIISIFETSLRITSSAPHHPPLRPHPRVISTQRRCATSTPIRATPRRPRWTAGRRRAHALRDHCASPSSAPHHHHFRPYLPATSITLGLS